MSCMKVSPVDAGLSKSPRLASAANEYAYHPKASNREASGLKYPDVLESEELVIATRFTVESFVPTR